MEILLVFGSEILSQKDIDAALIQGRKIILSTTFFSNLNLFVFPIRLEGGYLDVSTNEILKAISILVSFFVALYTSQKIHLSFVLGV